jgi:hypothetical protein
MTSSPWLDTLIMFLVVGVPVGLVFWYLRRPYDEGSVPRDARASAGKAKVIGPGMFVWPTRAYRDSLVDTADDASHDKKRLDEDAEEFDTNDFTDSETHRAQVVRDLKNGR